MIRNKLSLHVFLWCISQTSCNVIPSDSSSIGQSIKIVDSGISASIGTNLWNDKNYKILRLSPILKGLTIALLPYEIEPDINIVIDIGQASTIYFAIHPDSISENATDWLETNSWQKLENKKIIYSGENGTEGLDQIWFNEYLETTNLNTTFSSEPITIAMFIKPEKCVVEGYTIQDYPGQIRMGYSTFKEAKFECSTGNVCGGITFEPDEQEWTLRWGKDLVLSSNVNEKSILRSCYDCVNGDVKIDEADVSMIYWIDSWVPICGHYFWNNQIGADKFCQKMGYRYGVVSGKGQGESYIIDSFKHGQCDSNDAWLQCSGGCNDYSIGGKCVDDINLDCSAGQPVKINITCEGPSLKTTSCEGACASHECQNNGICTNVNGAAKCLCIEGYKGDQCEEVIMTVFESCDNTYNNITHEIQYLPTNASNETFIDCSWTITVPDDRSVVLDFIDLQIGSSTNCENSSLEAFDGPNARFTRLGEKLCGDLTRRTLESSSNELYLRFTSDFTLISLDRFTIKCSISDYIVMDGDIIAYNKIDPVIDDEYDYYNEFEDAIEDKNHLWSLDETTGTVVIPYKIDDSISPAMRNNIMRAISEYDKKTCIRFTEDSGVPVHFHLFFKDSTICRSAVGKTPDRRNPNKHSIKVGGCESFGSVIHELMHSIGFFHEMMRLDRDEFVNIDYKAMEQYEIAKYSRVKKKINKQYTRCDLHKIGKKKGCQEIGANYDGDSIMNYSPSEKVQVIENGQFVFKHFTLFTLKPEAHALCKGGICNPGQRDGLSLNDIKEIQILYGTTCGNCFDGIQNQDEIQTDCGGPCKPCPGDKLVILGGSRGYQYENYLFNIELITPSSNNDECNNFFHLNEQVHAHASVLSPDGNIITCGGKTYTTYRENILSKCQIQTSTGETRSFPSMNYKRYWFGMVIVKGIMYAIGGGSSSFDKMESINVNTGKQWNKEQNMPFRVWRHCVVTIKNKIVVIGGGHWSNGRYFDAVWIYDTIHKSWTQGPSLNVARGYHACMVDQKTSTIHVMGGYGHYIYRISPTEKLNFNDLNRKWEMASNLKEGASFSAAVSSRSNEFVGYLVGGVANNGQTNKIWGLRRSDQQWIDTYKRLKIPRTSHTVVNIYDNQSPNC